MKHQPYTAINSTDAALWLPSLGDMSLAILSLLVALKVSLRSVNVTCGQETKWPYRRDATPRLPSLGDVSLSFSVPSLSHHPRQPSRSRVASNAAETSTQKERDSLTQSVSDVLSISADELMRGRRRDRMSSWRVLLQTKIYNFLERPTGWRCFLYHFCVYVNFAFTTTN